MDTHIKPSMKLVLVCGFSNQMVRSHLRLDNRKLYNSVRKLMGLPAKRTEYIDVAGWDTNMIENLSKRDDLDLYVISTHSGMKKSKVNFQIGNVKYWFLRSDRVTMLKHVIKSPSIWHKLNLIRPKVRNIIRKINPDVIALIGAENPHISGTILGLEKEYPIIVKAQTIYNNPERAKTGSFDEKNGFVEKLIFRRIPYFSVTTKTHSKLFREFNPTAPNLKWSFGTTFPEVKRVPKEYDFVNYAMGISDKKGYFDAVKALAIVKEDFPQVRMNLVGSGDEIQLQKLHTLIQELNLEDNITLTPSFPAQDDVFQHIQKSKFALLPCKLDYVSSTIRQAMHYELPVICYRTEGTALLNSDNQKVLIAENGNYKDLAAKMLTLLKKPGFAEEMSINAKIYADKIHDNKKITDEIVEILKAVVANSKDGTPLPSHLLYEES